MGSDFASEAQLLAVHDGAYLQRLRATGNAPLPLELAERLMAGTEEELEAYVGRGVAGRGGVPAVPTVPVSHDLVVGSNDNPHCDATANVAGLAAGGACLAVDLLATNSAVNAFSVLRPPGHHCGADAPAGFCAWGWGGWGWGGGCWWWWLGAEVVMS